MRELKFRVWDSFGEKFIFPERGYQGHYILDLKGRFFNLQNGGSSEYLVQQWTGCTDKTGKDIYEGDILIYEEDKDCTGEIEEITLVCKYQEYNAWYGFYEPKEQETEDLYSGYYWMEIQNNCKVIGNIFENPKLLNNK